MRTHLGLTIFILFSGLGCASQKAPPQGNTAPPKNEPEQVTGIGGVFFKVREPKKMAAWYRDYLGVPVKNGYADFNWRESENPSQQGRTIWSLFPTNTTYFGPSSSTLMINYRVRNLDRMLDQLRQKGVKIEKVQTFNYGKFAWITDPEGNRIELWEPKGK